MKETEYKVTLSGLNDVEVTYFGSNFNLAIIFCCWGGDIGPAKADCIKVFICSPWQEGVLLIKKEKNYNG